MENRANNQSTSPRTFKRNATEGRTIHLIKSSRPTKLRRCPIVLGRDYCAVLVMLKVQLTTLSFNHIKTTPPMLCTYYFHTNRMKVIVISSRRHRRSFEFRPIQNKKKQITLYRAQNTNSQWILSTAKWINIIAQVNCLAGWQKQRQDNTKMKYIRMYVYYIYFFIVEMSGKKPRSRQTATMRVRKNQKIAEEEKLERSFVCVAQK